uniref:Glycosyltransferase family 92 protein n=1 Tax=Ascaris lumbricoides TaxID=6252 RepID=A0A9J2Q684_ASCLU
MYEIICLNLIMKYTFQSYNNDSFTRFVIVDLTTIVVKISMLIGICKYFSVAMNSTDPKREYFIFGMRTRIFKYKDYCVLPNIIHSKMSLSLNYYKRITLVLHADHKFLDETIFYQVDAWDGPISFAVVIPSTNLNKTLFATIEKVRQLVADAKGKLSVHIVYRWPANCEEVFPEHGWRVLSSALYPANTARNIARMLSRTKYLLIADYAHIFSLNFERQMLKLAEEILDVDSKTVLVFRIFEANTTASSVPRDKHTLYEAYKKGEVIEFHGFYSPGTHSIPDLEEWFKRNVSYEEPLLSVTLPVPRDKHALYEAYKKGEVIEFHGFYSPGTHSIPDLEEWFKRNVSYEEPLLSVTLPYDRLSWEPQFVSLATIPFHDEHFPYTVKDNTVLRWEMCRLKYKFVLVENVFMVHPGIKSYIDRNERLRGIAKPIFESAVVLFEKRMDECCPETKIICPELPS